MKKVFIFLLSSLIAVLLLSGCNIDDTNIDNDIFQFKDSLAGDNSAVGNIANQLSGAAYLNGFELQTNEEPYEIILNYDWMGSEEEYKETVITNATYLFTLVQNVDLIIFNSGIRTYTIARKNLEERYGKDLREIQNEDVLRELVQEHLEDEDNLNKLLN